MTPADGGLVQLLTPEGERVHHPDYDVDLTAEELRSLYRDLVLVRRVDVEATALQRQGELGLWAPLQGQEAAQVGAGRALRSTDFVFPTYREHGIAWTRGVDPLQLLGLFRGVTNGGWDPREHNFALYTIVIGDQCLHAVGYGMGIQRDGTDDAVMVCFGDGATSQGDVNEAFVFASVFNAPVVFFCQNNQWAISEPLERQTRIPLYRRASGFGFPGVRVDGNDVLAVLAVVRAALASARDGEGPVLVEAFTYRMGAHTTSDDPTRYRIAADVEAWKLKDPIERLKVHLARSGQADAAFFAAVEDESERLAVRLRDGCRALPDPSPLSAFTHVYAEPHPLVAEELATETAYLASFSHEGPLDPLDGTQAPQRQPGRCAEMPVLTMAKALNAGLRHALDDDDRVLLMGEDIGRLGGVFRVTDGLQKDFGEARVIDTPLAESGIIGTAVGLAMRGYRPVCEIQFDGFVYPAFDQIVSQVAKHHARSDGRTPMPVVIRIPYGGGIGAVEHHSESPEAYFMHTAGLRVVTPSNPLDAFTMIRQAVACEDPVVFLEPKRRYWDKGEVDDDVDLATAMPAFVARVVRPGRDVTVACYGPMVRTCLEAATAAEDEGRSLEVVDLRSLSPLDVDTVAGSVARTGRLVVVHEAPVFLGPGAELAARITERCFYTLQAPVIRVGGWHTPYPPSRIEEHYLPDLDRVLDAVDRSMAF